MYEPQANLSVKEKIRDTFTPSRLGLLTWAFAAIFMGTIGLASYKFGAPQAQFAANTYGIAGLPLPAPGDVTTTASLPTGSPGGKIEVIHMPASNQDAGGSDLEQSQILVLQEQIVRLRRRLSVLSEKNDAYSRRIAALEKRHPEPGSAPTLSSTEPEIRLKDNAVGRKLPIEPGYERTALGPLRKPNEQIAGAAPTDLPDRQTPTNHQSISPSATHQTEPFRSPRRIKIHTGQQVVTQQTAQTTEPVRIVELPQPGLEPEATGSINPEARIAPQAPFDAEPTTNVSKPKIIAPSDPVGRLHGSGQNILKRIDFGAIVGNYRTLTEAANAWSKFKDQNLERMRDLQPLLKERGSVDGGVSLLVGPFGNAADAAAACFYLLEVTEFCRPALYVGDPLITSAEFKASAFQ